MKVMLGLALCLMVLAGSAHAEVVSSYVFDTPKGDVKLSFLGHASLEVVFDGKVLHVDPYSRVFDYSSSPKVDGVLITHEHGDHFDRKALDFVTGPGTDTLGSAVVVEILGYGRAMGVGERSEIVGIPVEAVYAYNVVSMRPDGEPYHPKGRGNGYVLDFGGFRVYIAGDTELIPEMAGLKGVDVAILPANLPYTMSVEQAVEAARVIAPKRLFIYHSTPEFTRDILRQVGAIPEIEALTWGVE